MKNQYTIENILSKLGVFVAQKFNLSTREAVSVVAHSKIGNQVSKNGNPDNLTIDQLTDMLFDEISNPGKI